MAKIEKAIILLFYVVLLIFMVPAIWPMISGSASWILVPVLLLFLVAFPILLLFKKED
jgi:hypothetical protein